MKRYSIEPIEDFEDADCFLSIRAEGERLTRIHAFFERYSAIQDSNREILEAAQYHNVDPMVLYGAIPDALERLEQRMTKAASLDDVSRLRSAPLYEGINSKGSLSRGVTLHGPVKVKSWIAELAPEINCGFRLYGVQFGKALIIFAGGGLKYRQKHQDQHELHNITKETERLAEKLEEENRSLPQLKPLNQPAITIEF